MKVKETMVRSVVKSITWRVLAMILTMFIIYIFTRDLISSGLITITGAGTSMILYYIHERIWTRIKWGYK